ncbi:hypothetical protein LCGC14_0872300 [marine sediment metagenome]|uniref:Uncharacterized protein n=1 Tax=marine sediment metagenome TaxID=412755 RepID=A0A0F9SB89_9ZZZZ
MLLHPNKVKRITASGGGSLTVASGKSIVIRRVECIPSTNDTYLVLSVDRVTVAAYRVAGRAGNQLGCLLSAYHYFNIMDFLTKKTINVFIPVAEGQTFTVSRYAETGNVIIVYDEFSAGDAKATDPNGSEASVYTFLQYMSTSVTPTASQDILLDTSLSPAEFPDFPAGEVVPAGHKIDLLGICGMPFSTGAAGPNAWGTSFIKMIKDREVLFDDDKNGIPFDGQDATATADAYLSNFSLVGPGVTLENDDDAAVLGDPLMFDVPFEFGPGLELNVYLSGIMTTAAAWEETMVDFACILRDTKL